MIETNEQYVTMSIKELNNNFSYTSNKYFSKKFSHFWYAMKKLISYAFHLLNTFFFYLHLPLLFLQWKVVVRTSDLIVVGAAISEKKDTYNIVSTIQLESSQKNNHISIEVSYEETFEYFQCSLHHFHPNKRYFHKSRI